MSMKEQLAKAHWEWERHQMEGDHHPVEWEEIDPVLRRSRIRHAAWLLAAMREPAEAMVEAAVEDWHEKAELLDDQLSRIYRTMIDAASQEDE